MELNVTTLEEVIRNLRAASMITATINGYAVTDTNKEYATLAVAALYERIALQLANLTTTATTLAKTAQDTATKQRMERQAAKKAPTAL